MESCARCAVCGMARRCVPPCVMCPHIYVCLLAARHSTHTHAPASPHQSPVASHPISIEDEPGVLRTVGCWLWGGGRARAERVGAAPPAGRQAGGGRRMMRDARMSMDEDGGLAGCVCADELTTADDGPRPTYPMCMCAAIARSATRHTLIHDGSMHTARHTHTVPTATGAAHARSVRAARCALRARRPGPPAGRRPARRGELYINIHDAFI